MIGDSECTLASLEKVISAFGEYFGNSIGEIVNLQSNIKKYCPVGNDGGIQQVITIVQTELPGLIPK